MTCICLLPLPPGPFSTLLSCSAWRSAQRSLRIYWSWSFARWFGLILLSISFEFCPPSFVFFVLLTQKQPEQPVSSCPRVTRRATCTAVDRATPRPPTRCSCSEWRAISPRGFCTSTKTTLFTGKVCPFAPSWLPSPVLLKGKKKKIHQNFQCSPCWILPATTSWCCLSHVHKLQHQ